MESLICLPPFESFIGKTISSLPTPCLVIDQVVYYENLKNLKEFVDGKVAIRPHFKAHKVSLMFNYNIKLYC